MVACIVLLLIVALLGELGFAVHPLWFLLIVALILWMLGFLVGGVEAGVGRRRWYGRWWCCRASFRQSAATQGRKPSGRAPSR
jgi:hypothetical protein